jgi:hypothetical protein
MGILSARQTMTPRWYRKKMEKLMVLSAGEERAFRALASKGMLPLDYMLGVMRDPTESKEERMRMAVAAAPYVHPRLASIQTTAHVTGHLTLEDLVAATLPEAKKLIEHTVVEAEVIREIGAGEVEEEFVGLDEMVEAAE